MIRRAGDLIPMYQAQWDHVFHKINPVQDDQVSRSLGLVLRPLMGAWGCMLSVDRSLRPGQWGTS